MAGTRRTQLEPDALPGRRYGRFSGKGSHAQASIVLIQLAPLAVPWERYAVGAFAGKGTAAHPPRRGGASLQERRPLTRFVHVATGGLEVDGRAGYAVGKCLPPALGGLEISGEARSSAGRVWRADGGLEVDGAAEISLGRLHEAQGGLEADGQAKVAAGTVWTALGGLQLTGEASILLGLVWQAAGGVLVDGEAESEGASPRRARIPALRRQAEELLLYELL